MHATAISTRPASRLSGSTAATGARCRSKASSQRDRAQLRDRLLLGHEAVARRLGERGRELGRAREVELGHRVVVQVPADTRKVVDHLDSEPFAGRPRARCPSAAGSPACRRCRPRARRGRPRSRSAGRRGSRGSERAGCPRARRGRRSRHRGRRGSAARAPDRDSRRPRSCARRPGCWRRTGRLRRPRRGRSGRARAGFRAPGPRRARHGGRARAPASPAWCTGQPSRHLVEQGQQLVGRPARAAARRPAVVVGPAAPQRRAAVVRRAAADHARPLERRSRGPGTGLPSRSPSRG